MSFRNCVIFYGVLLLLGMCHKPIGAVEQSPVSLPFTPGVVLKYSGTLVPEEASTGTGKNFEVLFLSLSPDADKQHTLAYVVREQGQGAWLWPERFGTVTLSGAFQRSDGGSGPALLYELEKRPHPVVLPLPAFSNHGQLVPNAQFEVEKLGYQVTRQRTLRDRKVWEVEVTGRFGFKSLLWIDQAKPLLVGTDERLFMGTGIEFQMTMRLDEVVQLSNEVFDSSRRAFQALLKLKSALGRPQATPLTMLTTAQLDQTREALGDLSERGRQTIFAPLISEIRRDVRQQTAREGGLSQLVANRVGKPSPAFELPTLNRRGFKSSQLEGKVTILHFWDYLGDPLVEPYGQVGYLDFLYGNRRDEGVQVVGVAVDKRLGTKDRDPLRKIRKLRQFMNLSYPIALDNGKVLESFGDPRVVGAKLPLFVVIGPDGKVTHYHAGFYQIKVDEGLRQLDTEINRLQ